jgi:hypothetical protein
MSMLLKNFILFWTINVFFLIFFFIIGHFFLSFLKNNQRVDRLVFQKLLTGLIITITSYALIKSGFRSYLIAMIPLSIGFLWQFRQKISLNFFKSKVRDINFRHFFVLVLINLAVFTLVFFSVQNFKGEYFTLPDYPYYAGISEILMKTGIENGNWDIALNGIKSYNFYHFFEMWFAALSMLFFNLKSLPALMLVAFSIFASLAVYSVYVILTEKSTFSIKAFFLSFTVLLVTPFNKTIRWLFGVQSGDYYQDLPFNQSILSDLSIKTALVIIFVSLLFIHRKSKHQIITLLLLLIALIYPTTILLIVPTLFICLIINWVFFNQKGYFEILITSFVFLFFNSRRLLNETVPSVATNEPGLFSAIIDYASNNYLTIIVEPFVYFAYLLLSLAPFMIIFAFYFKQNRFKVKQVFESHRFLIIYLFLGFFVGAFGSSLIGFTQDGRQLLTNFYFPVYILFGTLVLGKSILGTKPLKLFGFGLLLLTIALNSPRVFMHYKTPVNIKDYEFLISKFENNRDEITFISTKNNNSTYVYIPYPHLRWYIKDYFPTSLSLGFLKNKLGTDNIERHGQLYRAKYSRELIIEEKSIPDIIRENRIRFLIVEEGYVDSLSFDQNLTFKKTKLEDHLFFEFTHQ